MTDVRLTATNPEDSTVVPVACNAKGELLLAEDSAADENVKLDDGGTKQVIKSAGLGISDSLVETITLNPSGSAFFTGNVAIGGQERPQKLSVVGTANNIVDEEHGTLRLQASGGNGIVIGTRETTPITTYLQSGFLGELDSAKYPISINPLGGNVGIGTIDPDRKLTVSGGATFTGDVIIGSRNKLWMIVESGGIAHLVDQSSVQWQPSTDEQLLQESEDSELVPEYPKLRNIPQELTMVEEQLQKVMERLRMVPEAGWEVWDGDNS